MMGPVAWGLAGGVAATGALAAFGHAAFNPRCGFFGPVVWRGRSDGPPRVALTFDDGPDPEATGQVLDTLAEHGAPATFFVIGANAKRHGSVLERIDRAGHTIGNHSYDHAWTGLFHRRGYWLDQLVRTDEAIASVIGKRPSWFRPPMGGRHHHVTAAASETGHAVVTWSRRAFDGKPTRAQGIVRRLADRCVAGDIVTMHDGSEPGRRRNVAPTVEALGTILEAWDRRGLAVVPLSELIGSGPYRDD